MTCAQGLLRLLWGGGARSWSATGLTPLLQRSKFARKNVVPADLITYWTAKITRNSIKSHVARPCLFIRKSMDRGAREVVRASASHSVDLGFIPLVESYLKTLKNAIYCFPAWHLREVVENKPANLLVVSMGKAQRGAPPLCRRQVAQTTRKWQLPSECGHPVQNIATQFAFS